MQTSIILIGDSKGIILNNILLDKYHLEDRVEIVMEEGYFIIKPINKPRQNWDKAFAEMHKNGDDKLLIDDFFEDENWD